VSEQMFFSGTGSPGFSWRKSS